MTIVRSLTSQSYYRNIFNIKEAMCSDTTTLLAYVKIELFSAEICYYSKN